MLGLPATFHKASCSVRLSSSCMQLIYCVSLHSTNLAYTFTAVTDDTQVYGRIWILIISVSMGTTVLAEHIIDLHLWCRRWDAVEPIAAKCWQDWVSLVRHRPEIASAASVADQNWIRANPAILLGQEPGNLYRRQPVPCGHMSYRQPPNDSQLYVISAASIGHYS